MTWLLDSPLAPSFDLGLDLFPLAAGLLAAVTCGVLGNFLVLRRLSLMGDAISHSVLPGLVIAFLLTQTRSPLVMLAGATIAGIATVVLVELIKRLGRVESGAAMGVVFSVLFALGVLLIEQVRALPNVDLDPDCVLHGQLETLVWYGAPDRFVDLLRWSTLRAVPRQVWLLLGTCVLSLAFVVALFKELRLAAFDPALATTLGFSAPLIHHALMVFVAAATVAAFEAVGSILVIAMLICPAATARLLTDRLRAQILWSVVLAIAASVLGYLAATAIPALFDKDSVNAAGSMTLAAGALLVIATVVSPRHGVLARSIRRRSVRRSVAIDDLVVSLSESSTGAGTALSPRVLAMAHRARLIERAGERWILTAAGRTRAEDVLQRRHQWERYLVSKAGLLPDHVRDSAEQLEHLVLRPGNGRGQSPDAARTTETKKTSS